MAISLPESKNLPYTLSDGKEIIIEGMCLPDSDRFSINLCEGPTYESRTPLHFNVRFDQNAVVRCHHDGEWGDEERHGGFPFDKGARFQLKILVRDDAFDVIVNNNRFCEFNHKLPKECAQYLYLTEGCEINRIHFADGVPPDVDNPPVPYTVCIPGGVYPGLVILVSGVANPGIDRFNVNLVCGDNFGSHDVALHMDNRFKFGDYENIVLRTSKVDGDWQENYERDQDFFPFEEGVDFDIKLTVEEAGFKIQVNNQDFAYFNHRIHPPQKANHLHVDGNVRLTQVRFQ